MEAPQSGRCSTCKDVLSKVIAKERPQKVYIDVTNISETRCPACGRLLQIPAEAVAFDEYFYCWSCGQKLVVEGVEENE